MSPKQRSDVEETYEIWAKDYDRVSKVNPATQADKNLILPFLDPRKKDVILEIGCGTGRFTLEIAKKCCHIVGVDFSAKMLDVAREKSKKYNNVEYNLADVCKGLSFFKDQSFDKIACALAINHIPDLGTFFQEAFRLLKRGGILVFDHVNPDGTEIRPKYYDLLYERSQEGKKIFYIHSFDELVHNLHRVGFEIEQTKFLRIDESIRRTLTKETYAINKGRTFGVIIKAKKGL